MAIATRLILMEAATSLVQLHPAMRKVMNLWAHAHLATTTRAATVNVTANNVPTGAKTEIVLTDVETEIFHP